MKRIIVLPLIGLTAFVASAAGGFVWTQHATGSTSPTAAQKGKAAEAHAHQSAIDYVVQEFAEKPMERMQFLGYEDAIHVAMSASDAKEIDVAAEGLVRAQECAGIMTGGHRTTITREAIMHMHGATTDNPVWNRILLRASDMPSRNNGEPCRNPEERRATQVRRTSTVETAPRGPRDDMALNGHEDRFGTMHLVITAQMARETRMRGSPKADPIRMRMD